MRPDESFVGQPVRCLQQMLRSIAQITDGQVSVVPDGIYGPDTIKAVTNFQRRKGLRATGVTDQQTWEAIVSDYDIAVIEVRPAAPIQAALSCGQVIMPGEEHPVIYLAQVMLKVLADAYVSVSQPSMSGILDLPTKESLICFQELCDLPATGSLDKHTWHHLANHYPLAARISLGSPNDRSQIRR